MSVLAGFIAAIVQAFFSTFGVGATPVLPPPSASDHPPPPTSSQMIQLTHRVSPAPRPSLEIKTATDRGFSASPSAGNIPLTVTFAMTSAYSTSPPYNYSYSIDFGDGTVSSTLEPHSCTQDATPKCIFSASHTYTQQALFYPTLINTEQNGVKSLFRTVRIEAGVTPSIPALAKISPEKGPIGTTFTVSGTGLLYGGSIILDGKYQFAINGRPGSESSLTFTLPQYVIAAHFSCPPGTLCEPVATEVIPGQHTIVLENEKGDSNAVTITVTP